MVIRGKFYFFLKKNQKHLKTNLYPTLPKILTKKIYQKFRSLL